MEKLNNSRGFSLVELLSVVSIIGILAVIGIPNYYKFKAKAYQSEAKVGLAAIHAGQKTFFLEYQGYHSSLQVIGYAPKGRMRYNMGFGNVGDTPASFAASHNPAMSTKTVCTGPFGSGSDANCAMIMDTPDIPLGAQPWSTNYTAAAVTYEDNLVASSREILDDIFKEHNSIAYLAINTLFFNTELAQAADIGRGPIDQLPAVGVFQLNLVDAWTINERSMIFNTKLHDGESIVDPAEPGGPVGLPGNNQ